VGTLIDSGVFVAAERGVLDLAAWLTANAEESFAISAITASELLHGVHRAPAGRRREVRRAFVESILDVYPIRPFDAGVAAIHAELWAEMASKGSSIGAHDLIIAATALAYDCSVLTLNQKHFKRVPRLRVVVPVAGADSVT
jgi:tRNA(fMet)-specific endonuclease VapC